MAFTSFASSLAAATSWSTLIHVSSRMAAMGFIAAVILALSNSGRFAQNLHRLGGDLLPGEAGGAGQTGAAELIAAVGAIQNLTEGFVEGFRGGVPNGQRGF